MDHPEYGPVGVSINTDINDRKRAEEFLKEAIESIGEGFSSWDVNGRFILCNKRYLKSMAGIEDILKQCLEMKKMFRTLVERKLRPEAVGREEEWIREREELHRHSGNSSEVELLNGQWNEINVYRTSEGGTVTVRTDITKRKRMEKELAAVQHQLVRNTDNVPGTMFSRVLHPDGSISYDLAKGNLLQELGLETGDIPENQRAIALMIIPEDRDIRLETIKQSAETLELCDYEFRINDPDGNIRWMRSISRPHNRDDGAIVWDGMCLDITNLKNAKEEQHQAQILAEKANKGKSEFLATMSHELRTPLNAILGFTQLLATDLEAPLNAKQLEATEHVLKSGDHLLDLIEQVLDLAAIESRKVTFEAKDLDPTEIIESCAVIANNLTEQKNLSFYNRTKEWVLPEIRIDETRFRQVLLNLLSNAVKYNSDGGTVTLPVTEGETGTIRFSIADSARGIAVDKQSKVFSPFSRLGLENSEISGTGIGLTISKELVEAMGGSIGFESSLNLGSTFWVEFPIVSGKLSVRKSNKEIVSAETNNDQLRKHTVLCVEDDPSSLKLLKMIIEQIPNTTMVSAHTGELGVDLAKIHRPDVIMMDINLPGISGLQALKRLKASQITKEIPSLH